MQAEKLGLAELITLGVGGMLGEGIFSVIGLAINITGNIKMKTL